MLRAAIRRFFLPRARRGRSITTLVLALVLVALWPVQTASATGVCGTISTSTTWTAANSPYTLTCSLTVSSGATLTIEPGVLVQSGSPNYTFSVNGPLVAVGTAGSGITFTSTADSGPGEWRGISLNGPSSTLKYVTFRNGGATMASPLNGMVSVSGTVTIEDSLISASSVSGVVVAGGTSGLNASVTIRRTQFTQNLAHGLVDTNARLVIEDSAFWQNGQRGLSFTISGGSQAAASEISGSSMWANGDYGVYMFLDAGAESHAPDGNIAGKPGNAIYDNHGASWATQLNSSRLSTEIDWRNNYWGPVGEIPCSLDSGIGHLALPVPPPPPYIAPKAYGPVNTALSTQGSYPTWTWCYNDYVLDYPAASAPLDLYFTPPPPVMYGQLTGCGDGIHAVDPSPCASDPVDTLTGAFNDRALDLRLPGTGVPFAFARRYSSTTTTGGRLGPGWRDSYSASLKVDAAGNVVLSGEDGQTIQYMKQADGSFKGGPGTRSVLTAVVGGYELLRHDQVTYSFDSAGRLLSMLDRNGQGLSFSYDGSNRLSQIQDSAGRVITLSYNTSNLVTRVALPAADGRHVDYAYTSGRLTSVTDARAKVWTYAYDSSGHLTSLRDPNQHYRYRNTYGSDGRVSQQLDALDEATTHAWNASTQTATVTDARNHEWKDVYAANKLAKRIDPLNDTWKYGYDADLNITSIEDARQHTTTMTYDGRGNLLTRTPPAPFSFDEVFTYDGQNNLTSYRDGRGHTTSYGYDAAGNLTSTTEPGTVVTLFGRDSQTGLLTSITDARGKTTNFHYDADGNLDRTTTPDGSVGTATYDASGRMSSSVEARGNVAGADPDDYRTAYAYDAANELLSLTDPLQHTTAYTYDGVGDLRTVTDARNRTTEYRYDAADHLSQVIASDTTTITSYDYDPVGNLHLRTAPGSRVTTYEYDEANRLASVLSPAGQLWTYGYDRNGNRTSMVDAAGNSTPSNPDDGTTSYGYDNLNRLMSIDYSDATSDVSYGYDENGNRTSMNDGAGTASYEYDARDRLTDVTRGLDSFSYGYDDANRLTSRTYPGGRLTTYTYWDDGELKSAASNGETTSYLYDPAGRMTTTTLPSANGYEETRAYDRAGRLTDVSNANGTNVLSSASYLYDAVGNPTQMTTQDGVAIYGYDPTFDRLTDVCFAASCPDPSDPKIHYGYDAVGNRTSEVRPEGTTTYTYDSNLADELVSTSGPGGTVAYSFDANGNETQAGDRTFTYDLAGRMTATSSGSSTITYNYDGDGTRLEASAGPLPADKTDYLWDVNAVLPQIALERDGSGTELRSYLLGNDTVSMDTGGQTSYFHYDGIGSVVDVTSATGATQWSYGYEPFGAARSAVQGDPQAPTNPRRFAGELFDESTGLYHLRARQYDPASGRFLATDPLAPSSTAPYVSSYVYADDRPTVFVDPSGLGAVWPSACGVAGPLGGQASKFSAGIVLGTRAVPVEGVGRPGVTLKGVQLVKRLGPLVGGLLVSSTGQLVLDVCQGGFSTDQLVGRAALSAGAAVVGVGVGSIVTIWFGPLAGAGAASGVNYVVHKFVASPISEWLGWGRL